MSFNEDILSQLSQKIAQLQGVIDQMSASVAQKNAELNSMSVQMSEIKSHLDMKKLEVTRIQNKIREKTKISNEAQSALNKILDNTHKLLQAVDVESNK